MANEDDQRFPSQTADKYVVRFPDGMRERIAEAAKANNRSMNAEIVRRLDASMLAPASETELSRVETALKDTLIRALNRDAIRLREALLRLAILIERLPRLSGEMQSAQIEHLVESARAYAVDHTEGFASGAMSPEMIEEKAKAQAEADHRIQKVIAIFNTDADKLVELRKTVESPTLEQYLSISEVVKESESPSTSQIFGRPSAAADGRGQAPVPPSAEDLRRELKDPEAVRASTRQVVDESFNAGYEPMPAASAPPAQPVDEPAVDPKPRLQRLVTKTAKKGAK